MTASVPAPSIAHSVAEHLPYMVRFARRRLKDPALAEDVVQDTVVAALQGADQFAGRASARTWLTGILLRRMADALRRERRLPRAQVAEAEAELTADDAAAHAAESPLGEHLIDRRDPQRTLEARQSLAALESHLASLPATTARIVVMREIEGLSNDETARELGLPPASVSLTLHRARSRLRQSLPGV
jgi:RNA polymerase sigma-70 factor (ECF subfamily)